MRCYIEAVGEFLFKAYQEAEEAFEELEEERTPAAATGRKGKAV